MIKSSFIGMEKRILQPEQIIVIGDGLIGSKHILEIYFRIFDRGNCNCLPPTIVVHKTTRVPLLREDHDGYNDGLKSYLKRHKNAEYFLLDGHHRSIAATLCHRPTSALELKCDEDIGKVKELVDEGELFDWPQEEKSLDGLFNWLGTYLSHHGYGTAKEFKTVLDRVNELTSNGDLPQYMKDRYKNV